MCLWFSSCCSHSLCCGSYCNHCHPLASDGWEISDSLFSACNQHQVLTCNWWCVFASHEDSSKGSSEFFMRANNNCIDCTLSELDGCSVESIACRTESSHRIQSQLWIRWLNIYAPGFEGNTTWQNDVSQVSWSTQLTFHSSLLSEKTCTCLERRLIDPIFFFCLYLSIIQSFTPTHSLLSPDKLRAKSTGTRSVWRGLSGTSEKHARRKCGRASGCCQDASRIFSQ